MVKHCAALFCRKVIEAKETFYYFPSPNGDDAFRMRIWQQRLLAPKVAKQVACTRHFSTTQFIHQKGKAVKLKDDAVPDQNIIPRIDPKDPLDAVCRLCLERIKNDCYLIHPVWPNPGVPSAKDIEEIFGIVISDNDKIPRLICVTCVTKVNYVIRIRNQYRKNDAIYTAKWESVVNEATTTSDDPASNSNVSQDNVDQKTKSRHQNSSMIDSINSIAKYTSKQSTTRNSADQAPKIASIVSYGTNIVSAASSTSIGSESERVSNQPYGEVVYVQQGNKTQRFRIISSNQILNQIGLNSEREEEVRTTPCVILPSDPGDDVMQRLYTVEHTKDPPDAGLIKIEIQSSSDFVNVSPDDIQPKVEEAEEPVEKKLKVDKPFWYANIKSEPS